MSGHPSLKAEVEQTGVSILRRCWMSALGIAAWLALDGAARAESPSSTRVQLSPSGWPRRDYPKSSSVLGGSPDSIMMTVSRLDHRECPKAPTHLQLNPESSRDSVSQSNQFSATLGAAPSCTPKASAQNKSVRSFGERTFA